MATCTRIPANKQNEATKYFNDLYNDIDPNVMDPNVMDPNVMEMEGGGKVQQSGYNQGPIKASGYKKISKAKP